MLIFWSPFLHSPAKSTAPLTLLGWRSKGLTGAGPAAATGLFHSDRGLAVGARRPWHLITVDPMTIQQGLAIWQARHCVALVWQGPDIPRLQKNWMRFRQNTG